MLKLVGTVGLNQAPWYLQCLLVKFPVCETTTQMTLFLRCSPATKTQAKRKPLKQSPSPSDYQRRNWTRHCRQPAAFSAAPQGHWSTDSTISGCPRSHKKNAIHCVLCTSIIHLRFGLVCHVSGYHHELHSMAPLAAPTVRDKTTVPRNSAEAAAARMGASGAWRGAGDPWNLEFQLEIKIIWRSPWDHLGITLGSPWNSTG